MYNSTHGSKYKYNSKYKYKYRYKYKYKYKCRHRYKIVSDCLACMTTHAIERASRSVVRQVLAAPPCLADSWWSIFVGIRNVFGTF